MTATEHKLARAIRTGSEPFDHDLAHCSDANGHQIMTDSFAKPIVSKEPLRYSFVVGGGKGCRQKYPESLPKSLREALLGINYEEDRHAAMGDKGRFKFHHDTDKNLKVLHVFPSIEAP